MVFIIKPISAVLTKDFDIFGKSDPYCVCIIGSQKQRTKTHQGGGKKPQWFDTLQFQSNGNILKVQIYDDDFGKDDFIGQGSVNLNQLLSNPMRTQNQYVDIVHKGKSAGRVLISLEYQGQPMGGNQGWGNQNQGWGNGPNNNQGWGNNGPNNNQGWGNNGPNNNQGWGNGPNNGGWGNGPNSNQGWGNGPNNGGWGNNGPNNNQGWGNNGPNNNQGWGNGPNNNQGWGNNNGW